LTFIIRSTGVLRIDKEVQQYTDLKKPSVDNLSIKTSLINKRVQTTESIIALDGAFNGASATKLQAEFLLNIPSGHQAECY